MLTVAAAYLMITTSLTHPGPALIALPMPDMMTCRREAARVMKWPGANRGLIGADCIDATPVARP